jgi:ribosome-associated translation inhibitor RaiA
MNTPLQITYRDMDSSPSTDYVIREQFAKLERHYPNLVSCRVVVSAPTNKHVKGGHFQVAVDVGVPGKEFVADRDSGLQASHEDCHSAVRDAFRAVLREVDDHSSRLSDHRRR